jgi:hypothetical protein
MVYRRDELSGSASQQAGMHKKSLGKYESVKKATANKICNIVGSSCPITSCHLSKTLFAISYE